MKMLPHLKSPKLRNGRLLLSGGRRIVSQKSRPKPSNFSKYNIFKYVPEESGNGTKETRRFEGLVEDYVQKRQKMVGIQSRLNKDDYERHKEREAYY